MSERIATPAVGPAADADELVGYWPSPWPAEDGGPTRRLAPRPGDPQVPAGGFDLRPGRTLRSTSRTQFACTMVVLREPGEVFLLSHTFGPDSVSWVERIHPETLETEVRSPDLPGGPFWPGGLLAHADGSIYVTYGRWCHRLDAGTLEPLASTELPRERPYNSSVVLASGHLVCKDIGGDEPGGMNQLLEGATGSELVVLEPGTLAILDRLELPEGSIARLSARGDDVYVVGVHRVFRVAVAADGTMALDPDWQPRYRTHEGQTFGWDIVLSGDSGWFLDNGAGTDLAGGSFRGKGVSTAPLHLLRVPLPGAAAPGAGEAAVGTVEELEVCGEPGGVIANPPLVDADRGIVVGYDSGHGVLAAWRFGAPGEPVTRLWERQQDHGAHLVRWPASGQVLSCDFDHDQGIDQVVVLDIESGAELGRVATTSIVQCLLFPAPGWSGDAYVCTFAGITRVFTE